MCSGVARVAGLAHHRVHRRLRGAGVRSGGAVRLAHYTGDQIATARPVHRVGICIGGGAMIHAEHTGTVVTVLPHVATDPTWGP
jgi:hypothetical protein